MNSRNTLIVLLVLWLAGQADAGVREASVKVINGDRRGSGTLVAVDGDFAYGVTCGHAFNGVINGHFQVETFDGRTRDAVLKDIDKPLDLAIFAIASFEAIQVCPLCECKPDSDAYTMAGFPDAGAYRETKATLDDKKQFADTQGRRLFMFRTDAEMPGGTSGGGVFCDGELCAVVSAGPVTDMKTTLTCTQKSLWEFAAKPRMMCFNGKCRPMRLMPKKPKQQPAALKEPLPPPVVDPPKVSPPDLSGIQGQIDELKQQIAAIAGSTAGSAERGPAGPAGAPGPQGPAGASGASGKDVDPSILAAIQSRLAAIETFQKNLSASRLTVPVKDLKKAAAVSP